MPPTQPTEVIARLGSQDDNPKCKVKIQILSSLPTPGFYLAVTEAGQEITVHRDQIEYPTPKP